MAQSYCSETVPQVEVFLNKPPLPQVHTCFIVCKVRGELQLDSYKPRVMGLRLRTNEKSRRVQTQLAVSPSSCRLAYDRCVIPHRVKISEESARKGNAESEQQDFKPSTQCVPLGKGWHWNWWWIFGI